MKNFPFTRTPLALAAGALLLAACGGGGGSRDVQSYVLDTEVPVSATTSAAGAFAFVSSVASTRGETVEPLIVGDATLGSSETEEPDPSI